MVVEANLNGKMTAVKAGEVTCDRLAVSPKWSRLVMQITPTTDEIRVLVRFRPAETGKRSGVIKIDDISLAAAGSAATPEKPADSPRPMGTFGAK